MMLVAWRLAWPYVLTPWRSPLLRWRMETFGITDAKGQAVHADHIGPSQFFRFAVTNRRDLARFLRWAATLDHLA